MDDIDKDEIDLDEDDNNSVEDIARFVKYYLIDFYFIRCYFFYFAARIYYMRDLK